MWNRACPVCFTKVSRSLVLTRSNDLECPACHTALELSRPSWVLASFGGLLAAFVAVHLVLHERDGAGWILMILAAILAFGIASATLLFFFSDLVVRPKIAAVSFPHAHK